MALTHPLHPIGNRSRNKRRNLWVGWCVSSWWPWFPSRSSVLMYIYIYAFLIWVLLKDVYIYIYNGSAVFALRFQNLPARNSSLKIFKHEKEEKLAGPKGKLAGPAQFLVAEGLGPALNAKTGSVIQYWRNCTPSRSIGLHFLVVRGSWAECHFLFSLVYQLCLALSWKSNTRMLVTFGICFKQHFDTRYLVFYNPSPPRMFLSLDLLSEYQIQHGANGPLYVTSSYSTWIFCRGVSGFATDCPCGVWCCGLTTCLLHIGPPFGNRILNNNWAVGLT